MTLITVIIMFPRLYDIGLFLFEALPAHYRLQAAATAAACMTTHD